MYDREQSKTFVNTLDANGSVLIPTTKGSEVVSAQRDFIKHCGRTTLNVGRTQDGQTILVSMARVAAILPKGNQFS